MLMSRTLVNIASARPSFELRQGANQANSRLLDPLESS